MSQTSSPALDADLDALRAALGGEFEPIHRDATEDEIVTALRSIRGALIISAKEQNIGVSEIARRAGVSKAAVSRQLRSDGDIRVSTLTVLAHCLGRRFRHVLEVNGESEHFAPGFRLINTPASPSITIDGTSVDGGIYAPSGPRATTAGSLAGATKIAMRAT